MYEDISIADDFDVWLGVVSGGVSLLIRPAETNPTLPDIFQRALSISGRLGDLELSVLVYLKSGSTWIHFISRVCLLCTVRLTQLIFWLLQWIPCSLWVRTSVMYLVDTCPGGGFKRSCCSYTMKPSWTCWWMGNHACWADQHKACGKQEFG